MDGQTGDDADDAESMAPSLIRARRAVSAGSKISAQPMGVALRLRWRPARWWGAVALVAPATLFLVICLIVPIGLFLIARHRQ